MSIEDQLKQLIVEKYGSVRAFTKIINVPYSTIDSMLKRGLDGTGVATVLLVCLSLQIDIEGLLNGQIVPKRTTNDATSIKTQIAPLYSSEALMLASDFDALDGHGQRMLRLVADEEKARCAEAAQTASRPMIQAAARSGGVTKIEEITPDEISSNDIIP